MIHINSAAVQRALAAAVARQIENNERFVREVAVQALADAQRISPVDTGLYRSAHYLTLRRPGYAAQGAGTARQFVGRRSSRTAATIEAVATAEAREGGAFSVHLVNPLIYAWKLEDGHSLKAPSGIYTIVRTLAAARLRRGPGSIRQSQSNTLGGA